MSVWLERRDIRPLRFNRVLHRGGHWAARKEIKDWREWARQQCEQDGYSPMRTPVTVTAYPFNLDRRWLPDTGACALAVKAVVDGMVDAGVIPGDTPDIVHRVTYEAPEVAGWNGLRVVVLEVSK